MVVIRDEDAETDDDELEFRKSDLVLSKRINENPTDQETASSYQAGQANAAAGKQRSLEMGVGGQDVVKTAGGSDVEEGMDSFVNPNDQDGTDNEKAVDPMAQDDLADDDLDENREMTELLRLAGQQNEVEETQDVDTGKQALKAERDPMLERMLNIVNR